MSSPARIRREEAGLLAARMLTWSLGVAGAGTLMWMGAALFGGATATAAAPGVSIAPVVARHRSDQGSGGAGQPARTQGLQLLLTHPDELPSRLPQRDPLPSGSVWDRLAKCESSGRWNARTGNGYYGGLQFSKSTWKAYGGGKYAPTADKATREQQIEIAQKVLAGQGPGAWPVCSRKAGLTRAHAKSGKTQTTGKTKSTTSRKAKSTSKIKDKAKAVAKTKTAKGKKAGKAHPAGKKYASGQNQRNIKVQPGDTLAKLAKRHNVKGGWQRLYAENKGILSNPNRLRPNQELSLPQAG